jgi:hypothetical protein
VTKLEEDRPLFQNINDLAGVAKEGEILKAVEKVAGKMN